MEWAILKLGALCSSNADDMSDSQIIQMFSLTEFMRKFSWSRMEVEARVIASTLNGYFASPTKRLRGFETDCSKDVTKQIGNWKADLVNNLAVSLALHLARNGIRVEFLESGSTLNQVLVDQPI